MTHGQKNIKLRRAVFIHNNISLKSC